jgi:hypothetical protein
MGSIQFDLKNLPQLPPLSPPEMPAVQTPLPPQPVEQAAVASPEHSPHAIVLEQDQMVASYDYDTDIHQVIITLRRQGSGEVMQQIPSEQIVNLLQGVMERLGAVLDRRG